MTPEDLYTKHLLLTIDIISNKTNLIKKSFKTDVPAVEWQPQSE